MIDRDSLVTEEELHALVDGELSPDRQEAVAAWLAAHPDRAALVTAWRAQADAIRARFGVVVDEPVPSRLRLDQVLRQDRWSGRTWPGMAAAAVISLMIGGVGGWFAHGATMGAPAGFEAVASDALDAYRLYVVEVRHPVEVPGSERAHMTQWLSKRLGAELRIPDLQSIGLKLVGGRLLPGPTGAAAFYMYEGQSGERYTIYCSKAGVGQTALRYKSGDGLGAFYWVDDQVAYAVSGPADREKLEQVTKSVYEQVDRTGAKRS